MMLVEHMTSHTPGRINGNFDQVCMPPNKKIVTLDIRNASFFLKMINLSSTNYL